MKRLICAGALMCLLMLAPMAVNLTDDATELELGFDEALAFQEESLFEETTPCGQAARFGFHSHRLNRECYYWLENLIYFGWL